ncbi:unnamed protein product, partial [Pylaiella littoralis]
MLCNRVAGGKFRKSGKTQPSKCSTNRQIQLQHSNTQQYRGVSFVSDDAEDYAQPPEAQSYGRWAAGISRLGKAFSKPDIPSRTIRLVPTLWENWKIWAAIGNQMGLQDGR